MIIVKVKVENEKSKYFEEELHKLLVHLHKDMPSPCVFIFWHWSFDDPPLDKLLSFDVRPPILVYSRKLIRSFIHPRNSDDLPKTFK